MQKTTFKTRLLALLTAAFMIVMCVPFAAFAEETKNVTVQVRFFIDGTITEAGDGGLVPVEAPESDLKAGKINVPEDKIPAGYEVAETKPVLTYVSVKDMWYASVYVEKKPEEPKTVTITVNMYDEANGVKAEPVKSYTTTVAKDAKTVTVDATQIPEGYESAEKSFEKAVIGDKDDAVSFWVKKVAAPVEEKVTITVNMFDEAKGVYAEPVKSYTTTVAKSAKTITVDAAQIPEGYESAEKSFEKAVIGDKDDVVSFWVKKIPESDKVTITVNMFDEANGVNGKPVKTYTVSADKNAKKITVDAAQIPTGYVKADGETYEKNVIGDKDDYVAFWIKKDAKAPEVADIHVYIKSSNNDLGTVTEKNIMLTKSELTGEYKAFALKATAKNGYHLTGWTVTADGKNVATVKADATTVDLSAYAEAKEIVVSANFEKNASTTASSTASSTSSSSNTTNTSASQKQVVKAAAAPANTTKVLPKTGATNAAPLIGGSLAVVALLMGYGVYGLVLRKKD